MDLLPSPDQQAIVEAVAAVLDEKAPIEVVRRYRPGVGPPPAWAELADLGVFGLAVPEKHGGAGQGWPELVLVGIELGRRLVPGPVLGTVVAADLALRVGADGHLADLMRGRVAAGVGFATPAGTVVLDATAELCVIVSEGDTALVRTSDLAVAEKSGPDPLVPVGMASANDWPVLFKATGDDGWRLATLLVVAQQVGIAEATLERAVAYAKIREQFGQPIGAFQAVKHRCAEMAVRAEVARVQTCYAALVAARGDCDAAAQGAAARVLAADAARANAADNIVTHGAMGFSDETDAHLFARRAALLDVLPNVERAFLESIAEPTVWGS